MDFENVTIVDETDVQQLKVKKTNSAMKMAGLFFFLVMILEVPLSFLVLGLQSAIPTEYTVLASILITQGYLLVCGLIYVLLAKQSFGEDLLVKKYRVSSFFLSVVMLLCASPMASWLNLLSQFFAKNEISNSIYEVTKVVPMWLGILIIGCLPGFIEELLFRGIIYGAFRKRSILTGIVVSALAFGLMHMNFNQIMYAVYLGVIFALLVEATGSLVSSMFLHMLFNAVNTSYVYILPKLYTFLGRYSSEYANVNIDELMNTTVSKQELLSSLMMFTAPAFIGLFLTILLLLQIAKLNGREFTWAHICGDKEEVRMTKPVNVPLLLGCAFCIAIALGNL